METEGIFIPSSRKEGRFTQMAFDNLDFSDKTKEGTSLHATTHVIYQHKDGPTSPIKSSVSLTKGRRRSVVKSVLFQPEESQLSISDRRSARSVTNILQNDEHISDNVYEFQGIRGVWLALKVSGVSHTFLTESLLLLPSFDTYLSQLETYQQSLQTSIHYGQIFPQSPTSSDVVKMSLDFFTELSRKLGQRTTIITCDQAIYDIAKAFTIKEKLRYPHVILRLGGFHIALNFFKAIGFFMKDSGIEEVFVQSGLCSAGTANKILAGKDYYQNLLYHSTVANAMLLLEWKALEKETTNKTNNHDFMELVDNLQQLRLLVSQNCINTELVKELTEQADLLLQSMQTEWAEYQDHQGKTARFWTIYIQMVLIVQRYIRAEREGNWHGHLLEVKRMLPYMVTAGHRNYASCIPLYLKEMEDLPENYPDVYNHLLQGHYTVHHREDSTNGIWTDMAIEQTYNKDGKTTLFKGIAQNQRARDKYVKTVPILTRVSQCAKTMVSMESYSGSATKSENLERLHKVVHELENNMINPFTMNNKEDLVNIFSGAILLDQSILMAQDVGKKAIQEARECGDKAISLPKIPTFSSTKKSTTTKIISKQKIVENENQVVRALCFAQSQHPDINNTAFKHEWMPYPCSLFEPDPNLGYAMRKGPKSAFITYLADEMGTEWTSTDVLPPSDMDTTFIVDAIAFIQRSQALHCTTFEELSQKYLQKLCNTKPKNCKTIHFVGDRYDVHPHESLKFEERTKRCAQTQQKEYLVESTTTIPEWKEIIDTPKNKQNLLTFLASSWSKNCDQYPQDLHFYLGGISEDVCDSWLLTEGKKFRIEELCCPQHEEADTRLILHLAFTVETLGCKRAVIETADTDVLLLCMYHFAHIESLQELFVHRNKQYIHIHSVVDKLSCRLGVPAKDLTACLLAAYGITGCDTVSFPFGRGKKKTVKIFLSYPLSMQTFSEYEENSPLLPDKVLDEARQFFGRLYNREQVSSLNTLRQHLFAQTRSDLRKLPPTEDAFLQHVLRTLFQLRLWIPADKRNPVLPSVTDFGRCISNDKLSSITKLLPDRPEELELPTFGKCKVSRCISKMCSCVRAGVSCTVACNCSSSSSGCSRQNSEDTDSDSESETTDEDS